MFLERKEVEIADPFKNEVSVENIPKGYIMVRLKHKKYVIQLPKHIASVHKIHTVDVKEHRLRALCELIDGTEVIRNIEIPQATF